MQLSEDEKLKKLQALKDLLSEGEDKTSDKDDEEDDEDEDKEGEKEEMKEEQYKEHLSAMFTGTDISEEAKEKLTVLFEAAVGYEVDRKVETVKAQLSEEMKSALEAKEAEIKEEADAYLSYVVEEWTSKNEVALKQQVKVDVLESFIGGLRTLFLEHNFNIPEEQANMVDALMDKVAGLEEDVKATLSINASTMLTH